MHHHPNADIGAHNDARETVRERLERDLRAITTLLAEEDAGGQVLERLPNGELAWLRPEPARNYVLPSRYVLTDQGRRAIAMEACFGRCPTVAEVGSSVTDTEPAPSTLSVTDPPLATCPACHQPQTAPSCATREHWGC